MRKYVIYTRVVQEDNTMSPPTLLEPFVHKMLYDIPAVKTARDFLEVNECVHMVVVVVDKRHYSVVAITDEQAELQSHAFQADTEATVVASEKTSD
jgi:hypothetical protein